ncbi:MAG: hypothetical protein ACLFUE_02180 [Desulfobacteraceae bacterium]
MDRPTVRKTNHRAIAGFLLPFAAMAAASAVVLLSRSEGLPFPVWVPLVSLVPMLLAAGLYLSIRSLPLIDELGDKDYAYSGLVLNLFLIVMFLVSLFYCLFMIS